MEIKKKKKGDTKPLGLKQSLDFSFTGTKAMRKRADLKDTERSNRKELSEKEKAEKKKKQIDFQHDRSRKTRGEKTE